MELGQEGRPRLLGALEMFGEIYVERRHHKEVFMKIGHALKMKKKQMINSGSMSMKSIMSQRRIEVEEINGVNEFRAERFRIRTPNVIVEGGEQGDKASGESKT